MIFNKEQGSSDFQQLKNKKQFILLTSLVIASLFFMVNTLLPPTQVSKTEFLILQKNLSIDAYRAAKSSEYAGEILKRVTGSSNFMEGVSSGKSKLEEKLGKIPKDKIKNWNKLVSTKNSINTGIISITVKSKDSSLNKELTESINQELLFNSRKYHGNNNIELKIINGPISYEKPEFLQIIISTLVAACLGAFLAISLVILLGDKADSWMYNKTYPDRIRDLEEILEKRTGLGKNISF